MKIHLSQIPQGEQLFLSGEEDAVHLDLKDTGVRALSPLSYALHVGLSEGGLFAVGSLRMTVELRCVVSLEFFPYEVKIPDFATQMELGSSEIVDLTPVIREDILLSLPTYPRKQEASVDPAYLARPPVASHDETVAAWSALKDLKTKN